MYRQSNGVQGKDIFCMKCLDFLHAEQGLLVLAMLIENWVFSSKEFVLMGIGSKVSEKIKVLNDMLPVMKQFLKAHESACILLQCPPPPPKQKT